jgi:putative transposase
VFKELKLGRGMRIGEKRIARLMRGAGLVSIYAPKRLSTTKRANDHPLAPDLVQRDFHVEGPNQLWITDFTQITTWQGTASITVVADAHSRRRR